MRPPGVDNVVFFLFKQKTAYELRISDWSSDVCSSDLIARLETTVPRGVGQGFLGFADPTGRKGYVGFASAVNDSFFVVNEMNWPMYFGINGSSQWQINAGDFMQIGRAHV